MLDERLLQFRLGDLVGRREYSLQVAERLDQLRRGLRPDPRHAWHIVDAVAHQREHVADLFRRNAELLQHLIPSDAPVVHRIEHVDLRLFDQLHQILVGADDRYSPARGLGRGHVARDDVVGLQPRFLDARDRKSARRGANEGKLGDQVLGRRRAVRLVLVVHRIAEGLLRLVEDHRHVRRPVGLVEAVGELPQHRRIAIDRACRLAVAVGQRRQPVIGAKDVARSVNEIEVRLDGGRGSVGHEGAGLAG